MVSHKSPKIITFTGASGVGKTAIVQALLERRRDLRLLESTTTRAPRSSDLPGEYRYVSAEAFHRSERNNEFLWARAVHGNFVGTPRKVVDDVLVSGGIALMILLPDVLSILRKYVPQDAVRSLYITVSSTDVLRERLEARGEDEAALARRLQDCKTWDEEALSSDIPLHVVENNGTIEEAVQGILALLFWS